MQLIIQQAKELLRGDGYRLEVRAVCEGRSQYHHQGGGQDHTSQLNVTCNNTRKDDCKTQK